jgi:DNA-binding LacI/PurR family transcriptional regulator
LGVSPRSVQKAILLLETAGLLKPQGKGKCHLIRTRKGGSATKSIRVGLLLYKRLDRREEHIIELLHQLGNSGHIPIFPKDGLLELGMNTKRVARMARETNADAWIVAAASREILEWFNNNDIKVFAFAGRRFKVPIAGTGPDKWIRYVEAVRHLAELGHKRIVFLCGSQIRKPTPALTARSFLQGMADAGIPTGDYNLPDWDDNAEGFRKVLESLFKTTPPTALFLDEAHFFHAAYHFLAQRNLRVPQDVSLICSDGSSGFEWCEPSVAHFNWDYQPAVRRMVKWVNNVSSGIDDRRQSFNKSYYVKGGTVGPAPDLILK